MAQILAFVVMHFGFLWTSARYHISGSRVTTNNGGDGLLLVESTHLRLRFVRDRGQLFLDLQGTASGVDDEWFSIDLLLRLLTDQRAESAELTEEFASFLRENLTEIESLFSPDECLSTAARLKQLRNRRAKELFG